MTTRYICGEEGRRRAIRDPDVALNGIDFLEVSEDQQHLAVHFLKMPLPEDIAPENVVIEGGKRITHVRVVELEVENHILNVEVSTPGDFSVYTLRLMNVDRLDPRLSSIPFSFKVSCPTDFDCHSEPSCPPATFQSPNIDYLARDYASFRQLMLDRISLLVPDWRERNPADLGVTLVEMLAYVGDHLSYFLDAVGTENHLSTARRRTSVRRHARLLDYFLHEGANARTYVTFEVEEGENEDEDENTLPGPPPVQISGGTQLLTRFGPDQTTVPQELLSDAVKAGAIVFETLHDVTVHAAHNRIPFYTWSDEQCCLPTGATAATVRGPLPDLDVGDLLLFEEVEGLRTGAEPSSNPDQPNPDHRHVVRLTRVDPDVDRLDNTEVVAIEWEKADALPFSLCLSSIDGDGMAIPDVSIARGNVVLADHGRTHREEESFTGGAKDGLALPGAPLTHAIPLPSHHREQPAAALKHMGAQHALPQVRLFADDLLWEARRDLLGSGGNDRHFVVEMEEDGQVRLRFGDNVHGMRAENGTEFMAVYRIGNGPEGNVGAEAIGHVLGAPTGILSVRNPLPAWGGQAPESLDHVRAYAPHAFKVQERAVTEEDYARVAERHPGVQRAVATLRCTGSWYTVFLTIDRRGGLPVVQDEKFVKSMLRHMDRFRMAGHDLEINGPRFASLDVAIQVCVDPEYFRGEIKAELLQGLGSGILSNGQPAFFHPDRWTFGQSVYLSQIYATVMAVTGVASAKVKRFQRWGRAAAQELSTGVLPVYRLEVVRLDNDPNFQENGQLQLEMVGGR